MSHSTTQAPAPGRPVPTPPDFPVAWDDARDAKLTWMLNDKYKTPIPPVIHAVVAAFQTRTVFARHAVIARRA